MSARPRASAGRAWLERLTLRGVLIVTLPLFALLAWLLFMPVLDYARASQFDDWWSRSAHVHRFLWMRLADAWRQPAYERLESRIDPRDPGGVSVRIFVDRAEYDRIAARAPENMETWLEAELDEAGKRLPVEIRLRGDSSAHWTAEKKSLSVKTPRDDFFHGQRRFALSIKDVLPQAVLGDLAREFGVLAPETAVVPVFLDERFHGLYRFVETPDESFLRRQGHMPGNVFRADRAERGEYMKGLARGVFKDPALWDRAAFNDRPGAAGTAALGLFLADLNGSERADHERVWGWLERAEIARLLAFLLLAGDPYHMSAVHNQFWYEEPASGRLHPVAWDVRLLDLAAASERLNPFWRQVLRDPRLFDAALGELERRLDEGLAERAVRAAEQTWARQRAAFDYERLRAGRVPDVGDAQAVARGIAANVATLREWMADARASALCTPYPSRDLTVVDVEVAGFAGLELSGLAAPRALPEGLRLFADANANGALDAEDRPLAARAEVRAGQPGLWLDEPLHLLARIDTSGPGLTPAPLAYRLFLSGPGAATAGELRPLLANRFGGAALEAGALAPGAALRSGDAVHPWSWREPEPREQRLAGRIELAHDVLVPEGTTWDVAPGTTFSLAPGVSLVFEGRALFRGTGAAPIRVERADPERPWGVFALQDAGSAGSRLEHVSFDGGGGALIGNVECKGMVVAHWTRDVRFEACEFTNNIRCDDALNAVQCEDVQVLGCSFLGANSDSIDFDYTTGEIRACTIGGSGNDGIDLMSCSPRIADCTIRDSGDKGISIGEDAAPLVVGVRIQGCKRGIEVKDQSSPVVLHTTIEGCELGLLEHVKNWRYGGGGFARVLYSRIADNARELELDERSLLSLHGTLAGDAAELPELAEDPLWTVLHRRFGVDPAQADFAGADAAGRAPGAPETSRAGFLGAPLAPLEALVFRESFSEATAGFEREGGVTRLFVDGRQLEARVRGDAGRLGRKLGWALPRAAGARLGLLVEYASENLARLELAAGAAPGRVLAPTPERRALRWAWLPLDPSVDVLGELVFTLEQGPRRDVPGVFLLGRVELVDLGVESRE